MAEKLEHSQRAMASVGYILEAAAELFTTAGFERTSVQAVADRAGVGKGLIGHHFQSKHGLLLAVIDGFYARQRRALSAAYDPELGLRPRVLAVLNAYFDFMCESYRYPRLIQNMVGRDERVRKLSREELRRLHTWIETEVLSEIPATGPMAARQLTVTLAGSVLSYFSFAPALGATWPGGEGLLGRAAREERRTHMHLLVEALLAHLECGG